MPKIELVLPGNPRTEVVPVADTYRITIERADGEACTDIEAQTVMSMFCMEAARGRVKHPRKAKQEQKP